MQDFLGGQLTLATQDPVDLLIGQTLIDLIDEAGYLASPRPVGRAPRRVAGADRSGAAPSSTPSSPRELARATSPSA